MVEEARESCEENGNEIGFTLGMMTGFAWGKKETLTGREEEAQK
jgi:hypothetical protein